MTYEGARWPLDRDALQRVQEIDRLSSGGPRIRCDRCGNEYHDYTITECTRPGVRKKYGAHLCIYCCRRCEYCKRGAVGQRCGYGEQDGDNSTERLIFSSSVHA